MPKLKFKCKGELENGKPCDRYVSTKMHKGISKFIETKNITSEIGKIKSQDSDLMDKALEKLNALESVPEVPRDWEFTLVCSRGHEDDYTYDEHEQ